MESTETTASNEPGGGATDLLWLFLNNRAEFLREIDTRRTELLVAIYNASKGGLGPHEQMDVLQDTYEAILRMNNKDDFEDIESYMFTIAKYKAIKAVATDNRKNRFINDLRDGLPGPP